MAAGMLSEARDDFLYHLVVGALLHINGDSGLSILVDAFIVDFLHGSLIEPLVFGAIIQRYYPKTLPNIGKRSVQIDDDAGLLHDDEARINKSPAAGGDHSCLVPTYIIDNLPLALTKIILPHLCKYLDDTLADALLDDSIGIKKRKTQPLRQPVPDDRFTDPRKTYQKQQVVSIAMMLVQ